MTNVLILCDDDQLCELGDLILQQVGYQCMHAATIHKAVSLLKEKAFDLLIVKYSSYSRGIDNWRWLDVYNTLVVKPELQATGIIVWLPKISWTEEGGRRFYDQLDALKAATAIVIPFAPDQLP